MKSRPFVIPCFVVFAYCFSLPAQTYKPQRLVFTGAPAYSSADLTTVAGIAAGKPLTSADIDHAMQRLSDTGLFADMRYTVNDQALTLALVPQADSKMLRAVFSNFVVFDSLQLERLVHARVPLFAGKIPNEGTLQQMVQDALAAILLDKSITGKVDSIAASDRINGPVNVMVFSISEPAVQIRELRVDAVSAISQAKIAEVCRSYAATDYDRFSDSSIRRRLEDAFGDLGFLDIVIDQTTHSAPVVEPSRILVDVSTTAHEGAQYRIASIDWPVSNIVPIAIFQKSAVLKPGEPAARVLLLQTTQKIGSEFERRGYFDEKTSVADRKDATAHIISYSFSVEPGVPYHLKNINFPNLTEQQQKDFDKNWKLSPGSQFDGDYAAIFFQQIGSIPSFRGYSAKYKLIADRSDHTVQLTASLAKGGK
jgi:outer membrane protein assembly factor BamA